MTKPGKVNINVRFKVDLKKTQIDLKLKLPPLKF